VILTLVTGIINPVFLIIGIVQERNWAAFPHDQPAHPWPW
jgi:hypothetical protein